MSSAMSMIEHSSDCCSGGCPDRACSRSWASMPYAEYLSASTPSAVRRRPRGTGPSPSEAPSRYRVQGYFATAVRTAAVRLRPRGAASLTSSAVRMR